MAIFWILLGLMISGWSATFPFGGLKAPGPALLPLACGLILILLGAILLFQTRASGRGASGRLFPEGASGKRVALTLGSLCAFAILLEPVGFSLTVLLLILFLMRAIQPQRWSVTLFYAFVSAGGAFIVFKVLLKTQFPEGFLGF
jgi:putative tricarboxylic transport membrane protein